MLELKLTKKFRLCIEEYFPSELSEADWEEIVHEDSQYNYAAQSLEYYSGSDVQHSNEVEVYGDDPDNVLQTNQEASV